jgi:hypothetical protein
MTRVCNPFQRKGAELWPVVSLNLGISKQRVEVLGGAEKLTGRDS